MGSMVSFEELVQVEAGVPLTTTLHIAKWTGVKHKNILELLKRFLSDFEEFGLVRFETLNSAFETPNSQGLKERSTRGRSTEYACLNEGQATLLLTYMRNTDIIRQFKIALVKAFLAARNLITTDYMSLVKQHAALSIELKNERELASFSGYSLSMWKQKHKRLKSALEDVQQKMQPCLNFY